MRRNELIKLRNLVEQEKQRRKRIKELLSNDLIQEYLRITNTKFEELDDSNIKEILEQILSSFEITKTNGIYVCTSAYYIDCDICYEETNYYSRNVNINSEYAEHRVYTDIESGQTIKGHKEDHYGRPLMRDFENENIILNPYNTSTNRNGYDEVKMDFFKTSIENGQAKAKKLVLSKYPRL